MHMLITVLIYLVIIIPIWRIVEKMGYPAPVALLVFIPFLGVIVLYVIAFRKWPIEKDYEILVLESGKK